MPSFFAAITSLLVFINLTSAAHAGFHVQFPWMTRVPSPKTRPEIDRYNPFCGEIVHNPQRYSRHSRSFLAFSGHPRDLVTALYSRHRVPRKREDFPYIILKDVPIQPSGQLCVNVTIPFQIEVDEMGVIYFEARDPKTGNVEHYVSFSGLQIVELMLMQIWCSDVKMAEMKALPEDHPAMCAANNETLIPMPDEYL
ncbi:uncharacterized protein N7446_001361 [Penicillium canescens]|uniref:Uncharacterized protein n=1 Tax=Penicillium canescens TaxID=5083 RepID=A0AAD6N9N2_PENCN|nr:uncharacterized protein N7446_001361 [Penicillium canescens]KAJ6043165.1 hypothetical protein N7460_004520 [Penicillium canescens]KAJ6054640.1 hypothetical protein N7444_003738 [Penicillium canescens]KAJ6073584.1 hypothetical protein N7446_001361 [Penicillium canescens]